MDATRQVGQVIGRGGDIDVRDGGGDLDLSRADHIVFGRPVGRLVGRILGADLLDEDRQVGIAEGGAEVGEHGLRRLDVAIDARLGRLGPEVERLLLALPPDDPGHGLSGGLGAGDRRQQQRPRGVGLQVPPIGRSRVDQAVHRRAVHGGVDHVDVRVGEIVARGLGEGGRTLLAADLEPVDPHADVRRSRVGGIGAGDADGDVVVCRGGRSVGSRGARRDRRQVEGEGSVGELPGERDRGTRRRDHLTGRQVQDDAVDGEAVDEQRLPRLQLRHANGE